MECLPFLFLLGDNLLSCGLENDIDLLLLHLNLAGCLLLLLQGQIQGLDKWLFGVSNIRDHVVDQQDHARDIFVLTDLVDGYEKK